VVDKILIAMGLGVIALIITGVGILIARDQGYYYDLRKQCISSGGTPVNVSGGSLVCFRTSAP
jgi:hypothetical protein